MTHRIWKELLYYLDEVHGERTARPEEIGELIHLIEAVEEKYKSFKLIEDPSTRIAERNERSQ